MARIHLVHWNAAEAAERLSLLRGSGHTADGGPVEPSVLTAWRSDPPEVVVIDLTRLPSHGREIALALRGHSATRRIPLVFAGGAPEKVARVRELLPDAVYAGWDDIAAALEAALLSPLADPVVPRSGPAGYSGTPLPKKLGIKPGTVVGLLSAPDDFEATLGELPDGAELRRGEDAGCDLLLWFVRSRAELEGGIARCAAATPPGGLWICWPKRASGVVTDISENPVRDAGLAAGLVDYKVAAVDTFWSGLKFARRKS